MRIDLDRLVLPRPAPSQRRHPKPKRKRKVISIEALLAAIHRPPPSVPPLAATAKPDPTPNFKLAFRSETAPGYRIRVNPKDLTALGGVLLVADLPIHAALRSMVERVDGPIRRRTVVDAARAAGVLYASWNRDREDSSDFVFASELLPALRQSVSAVLAEPQLLSGWMGPGIGRVQAFATVLTPDGLKERLK